MAAGGRIFRKEPCLETRNSIAGLAPQYQSSRKIRASTARHPDLAHCWSRAPNVCGASVKNAHQVVNLCRLRVAEAFHSNGGAEHAGDAFALKALACGSVVLEPFVIVGSLKPAAIDDLRAAADNLGITSRLGDDVIEIALSCGFDLYNEIALAIENRRIAA